MNDESMARRALRLAERGAPADASALVESVPGLMREASRRRTEATTASPAIASLATWALPRLAAVTAVAVIAATALVSWERSNAFADRTTLESVILGGDGTGDVVLDALLDMERSDG
jgi:hypothetical protein